MSSSAWRPSAASATSSRPARRWTVRATPRRNSGWSSATRTRSGSASRRTASRCGSVRPAAPASVPWRAMIVMDARVADGRPARDGAGAYSGREVPAATGGPPIDPSPPGRARGAGRRGRGDGHPDHGPPPARPGPDGERAADRLRPLGGGGEADVPPARRGLERPRRDADPVVGDEQLDLRRPGVATADADADVLGAAVAGGVGQQLARDGEDEVVADALGVGVDLDVGREAAAAPGALGHRLQRGAQPGLVEQVRVQVEHRLAELDDRLVEALAHQVDRRVVARAELLAGGEQVLQRVVVQRLGQPPARRVLGRQRLGDEPPPAAGEVLHVAVAPGQHRREERRRGAHPEQEERLGDLERQRVGLPGHAARVGGHDDEVGQDARARGGGGERRAQQERGAHGQDEEGEAQLRERAAARVDEHADEDEVGHRRRPRAGSARSRRAPRRRTSRWRTRGPARRGPRRACCAARGARRGARPAPAAGSSPGG